MSVLRAVRGCCVLAMVSLGVLVGCRSDTGPIPATNAHLGVTLRMARKKGDYVARVANSSDVGVTNFVLQIQLGYLDVLSIGPSASGFQRGVLLQVSPSNPLAIPPHSEVIFNVTPSPGEPVGPSRSPHEQVFFRLTWTYETAACPHKGSEEVGALTLAPDEG